MKICHVVAYDPQKFSGGVSLAVKYIGAYDDIKFYNSSGITAIIKSFFLAVKLACSDYDLIHFHESVCGHFYVILPKMKKAKTVYTSHGNWVGYFNVMKPKGIFDMFKARLLIRMQKMTINGTDITVAVSNKVKEIIEKSCKPKRVVVIHNGVDTKFFTPKKGKLKQAIWVGDNRKLKQLDSAIKIAKEKKMKLLVVGLDGQNTKDVEYLGKVPFEKMPETYNKCSLLIFPSKWEGHPLTVLEAMSCGLDIIASKESNVEIIPLKGNFYKISGKDARKIAEKNTWDIVRKKYENVYKNLLGK